MNIFGSGLGAMVRVSSFIGGLLIIAWAFWDISGWAKQIPLFLTGLFVIGLGQGLAYQLANSAGLKRPSGSPRRTKSKRSSKNTVFSIPGMRRNYGQNRLVMHGLLWVIFWMAIGAVISLSLYPMFPEILSNWVHTWQGWAQDLKGP